MTTPRRWRDVPRWAQDVLAGLAVLALGYVGLGLAHLTDWYPNYQDILELAIIATAVVVATRRLAPRTTFWVTMVGYPLLYDAPIHVEVTLLPLGIAGYGATRSGRIRLPVALAFAGLSTLITFIRSTDYGYLLFSSDLAVLRYPAWVRSQLAGAGRLNYSSLTLCFAIVLFLTFLGWAARRMDLQRAELETQRSDLERQNAELERLRLIEAREAVTAERTRIARELHDVVAHHVSAIVVRASATARVAPDDAAALRETTEWVADTGRQTLSDMREIVRVLRTDEATVYSPTGDISGVEAAIATARAAGLLIDFRCEGQVPALPRPAFAALTRITQEALTNILLHSHATSASVRVSAAPHGVHLVIADPGPRRPDLGSPDATTPPDAVRQGNGLRNMKERARHARGTLEAGPNEAGWEVRAWIPTASP